LESGFVLEQMRKPAVGHQGELFAETGGPLGFFFAGWFCEEDEARQEEMYRKSSELGCSWGQVKYAIYFAGKDNKRYTELLECAAGQKHRNPEALRLLGEWLWLVGPEDKEPIERYFVASAELGWRESCCRIAELVESSDFRKTVVWTAQEPASFWFADLVQVVREAVENGTTEKLDGDCSQICFAIGQGLFWYQKGATKWESESPEAHAFGERCLHYFCESIELQQESIFAFLVCWNRTMVGLKDLGVIIAKMIWGTRRDQILQTQFLK
jgi:hypothetical protein